MRAAAGRAKAGEAMGQFGRIKRLADLPTESSLKAQVREAASLNEKGVNPPRASKTAAARN
jgi:hypothetical protein